MADDVASLGFAVDSSQLVAASAALDKVNASAQRLAPSQAAVANASSRLSKEQQLAVASSRAIITAQAELGDKVELLTRNTDAAYRSLSTRSFFRLMAREASLLGGPLGQAINQFGIMNVGGQRLGVGLTVSTIAIGGMVAAMVKLVGIMKEAAGISQAAQLANVGGQNIQGLTAAAGFKGIDAAVVLGAMVELNKEVEQAKLGLGSLSALFRANGIAATTTEEAFFRIADLVKNSRNEAEKFSIVQQAGLPATNQMVLLLNQGAAALKRQADEARKLTDDQLRQARRLDDTWNEVWTNFARFGKSAFLEVLDFMKIEFHPERIFSGPIFTRPDKSAIDRINDAFSDVAGRPLKGVTQGAAQGGPTTSVTIDPSVVRQQLELEKQRIQVLGQTASVTKEVRIAEIDLQIASLNNVGVTKAQRDSLLELARERALGVTGIKAQTDSMNVQAATVLMGSGAAAEYTAKQNLFNEAIRNHKVLTDADKAAIEAQAKVLGLATSEARRMQQALDISHTFVSGFFTDLSHGVKAVDALRNAMTRLSDTLIDMATKQLVKAALGGLFAGASSGGSLFGLLGLGGAKVAVAHMGGIVGHSSFPTRSVPTSLFDNAPRFAGGGEVPIIAHAGEHISTPEQWAARGRGGAPSVVQHFYLSGVTSKDDVVSMIKESARSTMMQSTGYTNAALKQADRSMAARQGQKRLLEN